MSNRTDQPTTRTSGYRVREFITTYRPLRDAEGNFVEIPIDVLNDPQTAAAVLAPLIADQSVEVFGVACLSTKHRLLAWHVLSRGTRSAAPVSIPDVFVPACLTPGTTALIVLHNHPSGDASPSLRDAQLTVRLRQAADVLDIELLDHIIVGDRHRYFSFRHAGVLGPALHIPTTPRRPSHRSEDSGDVLGHVKASLAPLAADAALTSASARRPEGTARCDGTVRTEEHHD